MAEKGATTGWKPRKNTCLSIPSGPGTTLEKKIFFALGTLVDPLLAPEKFIVISTLCLCLSCCLRLV